MLRREFISALAGFTAVYAGKTHAAPDKVASVPFSEGSLIERARQLAKKPYTPMPDVPQAWKDLSYDQYRAIRLKYDHVVWSDEDSPFRMDMFHPGLYFERPIEINIVDGDTSKKLAFDYDYFDRTDQVPDLPIDDTLGYSGFRLFARTDDPKDFREILAIQGASYFRSLGMGQSYGLSARGIAVNTAASEGEEFPDFTHFWINHPASTDIGVTVHALMDSPSLTGLYKFIITPGLPTVMDVSAHLFARKELSNIGLGPLTSMFLFDQTNRHRFDDFRPAVHDNDGLLVQNSAGETLWRPLANPKQLQISSFVDDGPVGFGLMQRPKEFSDYADLEALYHKRPSLWVETGENWGKGAVTLIEIPADREIYDNIVAYWRPRTPIAAGAEHAFSYKLYWGDEPLLSKPVVKVLNTSIGKRFAGGYIVTVDFEKYSSLPDDLSKVTKFISVSNGTVSDGILQRNPDTGGMRLAFTFDPGDRKAIEMRAQLQMNSKNISEVWLYRWTI